MTNKKVNQKNNQRQNELLRFLKLTKDGKYAPVEKSSLKYTRIKEERIEIDPTNDYYYSLS